MKNEGVQGVREEVKRVNEVNRKEELKKNKRSLLLRFYNKYFLSKFKDERR